MPPTIAIDARSLRVEPTGTYVRNLIRSLAELDRDLCFVLLVGPQGHQALPRLPENFRTVVERAPAYSLRELLTWSWKLFQLRADVYHATHYFLPLGAPSKSVVTVHDIVHLLYPDFVPSRLGRLHAERLIRHGLGQADRVIATTQSTRSDLIRSFRVDGRKIEIVHNGIDDSFRRKLDETAVSRWLSNLGVERPYVVALASSGPRPNLDLAIRAFGRATHLAEIPDHRLVLVGNPGGSDLKLRERSRALGLDGRVLLLGDVAREALPALYQGADLFLWPSLREESGIPALEAMAAGVPVVSTATSALNEIAAGYAHLVGPIDVEGAAKAIAQCLSDEGHRGSLARLGARRARDFDWARTGAETLEVYRQVLDVPSEEGD